MQKFRSKGFWLMVFMLQVSTSGLLAQLNHFVYLQTDNRQPFYIKHNSKIISSSSSGYIILSKLNDGVIDIMIGFPQSQFPEQKFEIAIDKGEKGYLIKNFADKGWGLFDLQTAAIVYAGTPSSQSVSNQTISTAKPANDPFANMLSSVTQDSTVKNVTVKKEEKPVVVDSPKPAPIVVKAPEIKVDTPKREEVVIQKMEEPKKEETAIQKPPVIDTLKTQTEKVTQPVLIQDPVFTAPPKSLVQRINRFDSREGTDLVFEVAEAVGIRDTIRIFIAADTSNVKVIVPAVKEEPVQEKKDTIPLTTLPQSDLKILPETKKEEVKKEEAKIIPEIKKEEVKSPIKQEPITPAAVPNSNCKEDATEDDFLKLRKRMASQTKEDAMVNEAKKVFKAKCFSTAQIKNLAVLFLTDEWKYRFYDSALPFVSDYNAFKLLGDTIADEYYKKRFQALLPNQ
jgi:hypothetical protein